MVDNESIPKILEKQCSIYGQMFEVGRRQHHCIENEDYSGLNQSFMDMHQLMERARIEQDSLSGVLDISEEYHIHVSRLKDWLERLQGQRIETQEKAEHLLEKSRAEARQIGQGRKAMRSYGFLPSKSAKLFDGIR